MVALLFFSIRKTFAGQYGCFLSPIQPQEWRAAQSPGPGVGPPELFCLHSLLTHLWEAEGGLGARLSSWIQVPTCLSKVDRAWSRLRPHLEAPPTCHVPASSRLPAWEPCSWQVPVPKNSSGGDSSLELEEGDESGEGRQLYSQTHWGWGAVGGEYPTGACPGSWWAGALWAGNTSRGRAPAAGGEREPAHEPLSLSAWLCCEAQEQETLPSPRLIRKVLVPVLRGGGELCCSWGAQCAHMLPALSRAQGVQSWLPVMGAGCKHGHKILAALSPRAGPASALPPPEMCVGRA